MVYGRTRKTSGRRLRVPPSEWLWSPEPVHPAIIDRATWQAAQQASGEHATSRDGTSPFRHPQATRFYPYRGRVRCKTCQRRMAGRTAGRRGEFTYYKCPHDPANPRHAVNFPDHPRTLQAPRPSSTRSPACSSPGTSSDQNAPGYSKPSSPPPMLRPARTGTPRPPP
jgi:hypothetical protein